jgi:hypothetical protein
LAGGTAYRTAGEAWAAVAAAGGNDAAATAGLVAQGRSSLMSAGRVDQGGAGFGATLGEVRRMQDELRTTGTISQASIGQATDAIHAGVIESQGPGVLAHASMKPDAVRNLAPALITSLDDAIRSGDDRAVSQNLASLAGTLDAMGSSSPQNAKILADVVMDHGVVAYGGHDTVRELIEAYRGDADFNQMRREYQTQAAAAATGGTAPPPGPGGPTTAAPTTPTTP